MAELMSLPTELLQMIAAYHASNRLRTSDLASLVRVNRRLYAVVNPILYALDWTCERFTLPRSVDFVVRTGSIKTLEVIESLGLNINRDGDYPLIRACAYGKLEVATWLLDHGMPIRPESLYSSVEEGHEDIALLLLARGANPHAIRSEMSWDESIIHLAGWAGLTRVMGILVREMGISIDLPDSMGHSLLSNAVRHDRKDLTRELITLGADINVETGGELLLTLALRLGRFNQATILLDAGAIVKPRRPEDNVVYPIHACTWVSLRVDGRYGDGKQLYQRQQCALLSRLVEAGADLEERYQNGNTPVEEAVMKGAPEIVCHLLDMGADRDIKDTNGRTVLSILVSDPKPSDLIDKASMLLRAGARMDVPLANGMSLLEWAISRMNEIHEREYLQCFLAIATRAMLAYSYLDELLHKYTHSGQYNASLELVRHGAVMKDVDSTYEAAKRIIRFRITGGRYRREDRSVHVAFLNALINMDLSMQKLADLLPYAFEAKDGLYVETLLIHGVLSLLPERPEWLHLATKLGDTSIVRRMMKWPVDINHLSESVMTPLLIAIQCRHSNVARVLLDHGADPFFPRTGVLYNNGEWGRGASGVSAFEAAIQMSDDLGLIKEMWSKATPQSRPALSAIISHVPSEHGRVVEWLRIQAKAQEGK